MDTQEKNLLQAVKENFTLIIAVISLISSWAYFQFSISQLKIDLGHANSRIDSVEVKANTIDSVQGDLKAINAKLDIIVRKIQL